MNAKRLVMSFGMLVFVAAVVAGGTGAFFNDTETSEANTFIAGSIDLTVDSQAHYNGMVCIDGTWQPEDTDAPLPAYPEKDSDCSTTWGQQEPGVDITSEKFFDFGDLKPGDFGENTISLHVKTNDARACVIFDNMEDLENGINEPESEVDTTADVGELSSELKFFAWADDGDNVWENGEQPLFEAPYYGPASDVLSGESYDMGTLPANETTYVGLYWCYGELTVDTNSNELTCSGKDVTNLTQTDSLVGDIWFFVEQARNNPDFSCPAPREAAEPQWTDQGTVEGGVADFVEDDEAGGTVLRLTTVDTNPSRVRWTNMNLDTDLDTLIGISFDAKRLAGPNPAVSNASLRLFIDLDGDLNTADVQEIVYEPYFNIAAHNANGPASMVTGTWQTWPATLAEGKFWANGGFLGATPNGGAYATNFTLQQVLDAHAAAKIVGVSLGMGTWNPSQIVLVDNLIINGVELSLEN